MANVELLTIKNKMPKGTTLTPEQISFLKLFAPAMTAKDLAVIFNKRFESQYTAAAIRVSCKSRGIQIIVEGDGRLKKGKAAWNKGLKGRHFSKKSEFKPGQLPAQTDEIGTIKAIDGYLYKKVAKTLKAKKQDNWKPVHHLAWKEFHGDIPVGHVIVFKDGDKTNCSIANLDCISRAKLQVYNRFLKEIRHFECYESKSLLADLILAKNS